MKIIDTLSSAVGRPEAIREITSGTRLIGAIGRWRHQGAFVDLGEIDTIQLVFNVSGGQQVELWRGNRSLRRVIHAGSVGIVLRFMGLAASWRTPLCRQRLGSTFGTRHGRRTRSSTTPKRC
jgi:hypothetical protein